MKAVSAYKGKHVCNGRDVLVIIDENNNHYPFHYAGVESFSKGECMSSYEYLPDPTDMVTYVSEVELPEKAE